MCQEPNAAPFRRIDTLYPNAQPGGPALNAPKPPPLCGFLADLARLKLLPKFPGTTIAQKLLSSRVAHNRRESGMDRQTKHEIIIVTIASLAPIPLITVAVVAILS
jgi:hypothetical protein